MGARLDVRVLSDPAALVELSEDWEALVRASGFDDVFATPGFARAWWRAFGGRHRLRLLVVADGQDTRGVLPLYAEGGGTVWRGIGDIRGDYITMSHRAGDVAGARALVEGLARRDDWETIRLRKIPGDAALLAALRTRTDSTSGLVGRASAWLDTDQPLTRCSWQDVHPYVDAAGLTAQADLLDRYSYTRKAKWLGRQGTLRYERLTTTDAIAAGLDRFVALHVEGSAAQGRTSPYLDPAELAFTRGLLDEFGPLGQLRLDQFLVDDDLVAAHFGFERAGRVSWYRPCFSPAHDKGSPGALLLSNVVVDAARRGLAEVDLLKGLEGYKARFANRVRRTATVEMHRSRAARLRRRLPI